MVECGNALLKNGYKLKILNWDDQLAHNIENAEAYVEMGRQHAALVSP